MDTPMLPLAGTGPWAARSRQAHRNHRSVRPLSKERFRRDLAPRFPFPSRNPDSMGFREICQIGGGRGVFLYGSRVSGFREYSNKHTGEIQ